MRFLLDTHVWVWSITAPEKLNSVTLSALRDTSNTLFLSLISVWEALLLLEKGKIPVNLPPMPWVEYALYAHPMVEAPLTHEVAIRSRQLQLPHQDPADRFLAASAVEYGLRLMTADSNLLNSKELVTWQVA